jgi:hypothetical protein
MVERLFQQDLPEDILYLILVEFDGRYNKRNGIFIFKVDHRLSYYYVCSNLDFHYGNILKSKYLRNELYNSCIQNNNVENMVNIIKHYVKMNNLQYLFN